MEHGHHSGMWVPDEPPTWSRMFIPHLGPESVLAVLGLVALVVYLVAVLRLRRSGVEVVTEAFFDTLTVRVPGRARELAARAEAAGINLRLIDADHLGIALDETTRREDLPTLWSVLGAATIEIEQLDRALAPCLPEERRRQSAFLTHPVFQGHHSETEMLRYLRRLSARDYALDRGMIPLGSCTMKLNATTEMEPVSLPGFADLHPFAPAEDAVGYRHLVEQLEEWLAEVTGYDQVSIQPLHARVEHDVPEADSNRGHKLIQQRGVDAHSQFGPRKPGEQPALGTVRVQLLQVTRKRGVPLARIRGSGVRQRPQVLASVPVEAKCLHWCREIRVN